MLSAFTLNDFKSFREARLPLGPLTVLIGANAAGKNNAIEALQLLSWLAQGQKLSSIQYAVNSADRVVRGRVEDLFHRGQSQFALGCVTDDSSNQQVLSWLDAFPDSATQGIGMGDLSIKKEWEELCRRHRMSRVLVWTLDADLVNLDRPAHRR